jgi:hypothetical protein
MWIIVLGQTIGRLVICDNPNFKELIKAEED